MQCLITKKMEAGLGSSAPMAATYVPQQWPRHNLHPLPRLKALVEVNPVKQNITNVERSNKKKTLHSQGFLKTARTVSQNPRKVL